jgi:hypothetical protein
MLLSNTAGQWGPAEGPKCLQSNNAEPMLHNKNCSELIRGIQPAELPC